MKRIRFMLFALLAMLYATNASALIVGNKITRDGITYEVTFMDVAHDGHAARYEAKFVSSNLSGALTIPSTVMDENNQYTFNVTAIDANSTVPNATSVSIPNSVTTINANAFKGNNITSITIPATVTDIKDGAFSQMKGLTSINVESGSAKYSATDGVLYENKTEGKFLISYPVAKQGTAYGVGGEEFTVPEGVVGIATNGFQCAATLTRINLPTTLTQLPTTNEANGFTSATNLKEIKVASGNTAFKDIDGVVVTSDGKTLIAYPNNKGGIVDANYDAPPSIDPTHAKAKGNYYEIPAGVETIAKGAFAQVQTITAVKLKDVKKIEEGAFYSVRNLRNVEISASVQEIADGAISGTPDLLGLKVDAGNPYYTADAEGVVYTKDFSELVLYPSGRTGEYTTHPNTKKIRNRAFYYAQKLTKITFNSGLEEIGNDVFQGAASLKEIEYEPTATLKKIGTFAFYGTGLEKLTIPASVEEIGWSAFSPTKLKSVEVEANSNLKTIGRDAFANNPNLEEFKFLGETKLETIETGAFKGNTKLKEFTIPKTIKTIQRGAFDGNSSMEKVTFEEPSVIETIGEGAFQGASALKRIELPVSVTTIEKDAFNTCKSLTEIVIPKNVSSIDPTGFQECAKLEKFTVDKNNATYSSVDGFLLSKDKKVLKAFPPAKANTYYTLLPPTLEEIGTQAFYYVQALENITIPENVKKIDKFAFDRTAKLNTIAFLGKTPITDIDPSAFNPANVKTKDIQISIRKEAQAAFAADHFWENFKQVGISFFKETNGQGYGSTEFFPLSNKAVMVVDVKADVYTYVVPNTVENADDHDKMYEVRLWGDYAMKQNTTNIREIVFRNTLDYVGLDAFNKADGTSTVESIFFTSLNPTKDMSSTKWEYGNTYSEFNPNLKIYVKKTALTHYKDEDHEHAGWERYASQISYKIPYIGAAGAPAIAKKYGTFAREFDADFSIYNAENGSGKVAAFIAPVRIDAGGGDYGNATYHVKMTSVDENGGVSGNYSYIPAETGTLLKVMDAEALPTDFYYAIGEEDATPHTITNNMMYGVTVRNKAIAVGADPIYVIAANQGIFMKVTSALNMPVHKAYAKISGVPAGAKVAFVFDDNNETTGITTVNNTANGTTGQNVYYNLNGQRIAKPQHGVYIENGKKVIVK